MVDAGKEGKEDELDLQLMWTSHVEVLLQVMQTLRHKEVFADATVICGNKRFEVHQFVLSTSSLYLETLFRTSPGSHPVLMFPDAPPAAMEQLLNFMYLGQTDVTSTELDELLDLAEDLRIIGLMHNSNKSHDQNQTAIDQEVKKKKAAVDKNKRATSVNKRRSTAASKRTPRKVTKIKNQTSSIKQKVIKDQAAASKDQGRVGVNRAKSTFTGRKSLKTTEEKIVQDNEKSISVKSFTAKELEENKNKPILYVCQICQQEFKTAELHKLHMKLHYEKCLLSCPECPFKTLNSAVMNQHIKKHSVGKPYICPHCQVRHPLVELHVAHQKRNHPKMEVVVNKSPLVKPEESVDTGHKPWVQHSVKHTNQSSWSRAYLASLLGPVQQACTKKQTVSQSSNVLNDDSSALSQAEVHNERQDSVMKNEMSQQAEPISNNEGALQAGPVSNNEMVVQEEPVSNNEMVLQEKSAVKTEVSVEAEPALKTQVSQQAEPFSKLKMLLQAEPLVKTEMLQQKKPLGKNEMLPQPSKATSSTLQTTDSFTPPTTPSVSTSITKHGRKRKFSALGGKVSNKLPFSRVITLVSDQPNIRRSPRLQREKS